MSDPETPFQVENDINYYFEDVNFDFSNSSILTLWFKSIVASNDRILRTLNFIFCNDKYLLEINLKYLDHDTLTDVITFSYSEDKAIEGDIFISAERVKENAANLKVSFENELHRVMIHGLLHLIGLDDKTKEGKEIMTNNENKHLSILNGMILDKN